MDWINRGGFQIGLRVTVFITLMIFIAFTERNFYRAHVRGGFERTLELIAAFVMGIVLRGMIILLHNL